MALEYVELDATSGGQKVVTDVIDLNHVQVVKIMHGLDGANDGLVDSTTPLPVGGTVTAELSATDNAVLDTIDTVLDTINAKLVTGTVIGDVNLGATDNAVLDTIAGKDFATQTTLAALNSKLVTGTDIGDVTINNTTGAGAVNIQDGGNTITVDGAVTVTNPTATNLKAEVTNAGTFATQATLAAETTKVIGTVNVAAGQTIGVTSGTAANCKVEATIAAAQTLPTVTTVGTVTTLTNWEGVLADDSAFTPATSKVRAIGYIADETSTDSVDEGDVGCPRMTLDRMAITTVRPSATGEGLSIFRSIDLDESEEDVKTSAGKVYGWFIHNAHTATLFVKFYNATAASTTVGTTTPVMTVPMPAGASANVEFTNGIAFSTAICVAATTGVADADTGAPGANLLIANIFYK